MILTKVFLLHKKGTPRRTISTVVWCHVPSAPIEEGGFSSFKNCLRQRAKQKSDGNKPYHTMGSEEDLLAAGKFL